MNTKRRIDHKLRTLDEAREALAAAGISASTWAKAYGFKPSTVAAVLRGDRQARIGQGHKIAVMLRIKPGVVADDPRAV